MGDDRGFGVGQRCTKRGKAQGELSTNLSQYKILIFPSSPYAHQWHFQIELDTLSEAHSIHQQLESLLRGEEASILPTPSTESTLLAQAHAILQSLVVAIEASNDPDKLEEMLALNDNIGDLVKKIESKPIRPILELNGLGGLNGTSMGTPDRIFSPQIASEAEARENASLEDTPITPRLDKGKGKAVLHEEPEEMQEEEGKIIPEPGTGEENLGSPTDSRYVYILLTEAQSR